MNLSYSSVTRITRSFTKKTRSFAKNSHLPLLDFRLTIHDSRLPIADSSLLSARRFTMTFTAGLIVFAAFCVVALVQIGYYLLLFRKLAFYSPDIKENTQTYPVSVIVCARDEDENLARFLPGILVQNYPTTHEVIVVNDNSMDDSKYILAELKKTFRQLQVVPLEQEAKLIAGKKYPLSVGIKEAKHEIVLLTDADCVPSSENWIMKMQSAYKNGVEIVLGYSPYTPSKGLLNKLIRWETFHTALQYLSYALAGKPYMGVGRNLSYKRDVFFRNKGFSAINNIASGDDDLFINKVSNKHNTAIVIDKEAFTFSSPKKTWQEWKRQKTRHYSTGKYYRGIHKFLLGLYTITLFLFYPMFAASLVLFDWKYVLIPFVLRLVVQAIILKKTTDKLNEKDLFGWFFFLDIWMFFYYIYFVSALWKTPRRNWN